MKRYSLFLWSLLFLVSCASNPDKLTSSYVSPTKYEHYTCEQISNEMMLIDAKCRGLYASLDKDASTDKIQTGVGVIFWPAFFLLEGGDGYEAEEYSRLKGEYEALEHCAKEKGCHVKSVPSQIESTADD